MQQLALGRDIVGLDQVEGALARLRGSAAEGGNKIQAPGRLRRADGQAVVHREWLVGRQRHVHFSHCDADDVFRVRDDAWRLEQDGNAQDGLVEACRAQCDGLLLRQQRHFFCRAVRIADQVAVWQHLLGRARAVVAHAVDSGGIALEDGAFLEHVAAAFLVALRVAFEVTGHVVADHEHRLLARRDGDRHRIEEGVHAGTFGRRGRERQGGGNCNEAALHQMSTTWTERAGSVTVWSRLTVLPVMTSTPDFTPPSISAKRAAGSKASLAPLLKATMTFLLPL